LAAYNIRSLNLTYQVFAIGLLFGSPCTPCIIYVNKDQQSKVMAGSLIIQRCCLRKKKH